MMIPGCDSPEGLPHTPVEVGGEIHPVHSFFSSLPFLQLGKLRGRGGGRGWDSGEPPQTWELLGKILTFTGPRGL